MDLYRERKRKREREVERAHLETKPYRGGWRIYKHTSSPVYEIKALFKSPLFSTYSISRNSENLGLQRLLRGKNRSSLFFQAVSSPREKSHQRASKQPSNQAASSSQ